VKFVSSLNDKIMAEVMQNEELIESLRQAHPDADKAAADLGKAKFEISKNTKSTSIEFLSDNEVTIDQWIGEAEESQRVKEILRIWFALSGRYNSQPWCQHPAILDWEAFYEGAKVVLLSEATNLCKYPSLSLNA
jgi:5-methylcytosine-specific restriction endonuclease McrBC regulatory subunit McrC